MQKNLIDALCYAYQLGNPLAPPARCTGGLLHQTWQLETETGSVVIKLLNSAAANYLNRYRTTELIAHALEKHVPLVTALTQNQDVLFNIENETFMVFPFMAAHTLPQQSVTAQHAKQIGYALAAIHQAAIKIKNAPEVELLAFSQFDKLEKTTVQDADIAKQFAIARPAIEKIQTFYADNADLFLQDLIISHRDCDPKNVLWDAQGNFHIIDWESAGLINLNKDAIATAIYWSLDDAYQIRTEHFQAFFSGYQKIFTADQITLGFYGLLGDWLNWLDFNLLRMIKNSPSQHEFILGKKESLKTLHALPILFDQIDTHATSQS